MLKKLLLSLLILFTGICNSCTRDYLTNDNQSSNDLIIQEAKSYFESNATDLREVDFSFSVGHKHSETKANAIVVPAWKKAKVFKNGNFTAFEIPLAGDVNKFALIRTQKSLQDTTDAVCRVLPITTKLIMKKDESTGEYINFVVAMIGYNDNPKVKKVDFINNDSFSGYIFRSSLDGYCVETIKSVGGVRENIGIDRRHAVNSLSSSDSSEEVTTISLFTTHQEAYRVGEGGIDCPKQCMICVLRNESCMFCPECGWDMGDAVVTPEVCLRCNSTINSFNECKCCRICRTYPCRCYEGIGGGGSIGGGGTGGGSVTPPPPPPPSNTCSDQKCPACKGCLNPTKSSCRSCVCQHNHPECDFCHKCIISETDPCYSTKTRANHNLACSDICDCKCPICFLEINPETKRFPCADAPVDIYKSSSLDYLRTFSSAFLNMYSKSGLDSLEYGGSLSKFEKATDSSISTEFTDPSATYLIVVWDKNKNTPTKSYTYSHTCAAGKGTFVVCEPNNRPYTVFYKEFTGVHTHPSYFNIDQSKIYIEGNDRYMSYKDLRVSNTDIDKVKKFGINYILNEGNIYELTSTDKENGKAKIVGRF